MGLTALQDMNVSRENIELYYELLSLIFTFKPSGSNASLGQRMTKEDKERLKNMFYENPIDGKQRLAEDAPKRSLMRPFSSAGGDVSRFFEALPRDILFAMRGTAILRSINSSLGGTSAQRFSITVEAATRGLYIPNTWEDARNKDNTCEKESLPQDDNFFLNLEDYIPAGIFPMAQQSLSSSMNIPTDTEMLILPRLSGQNNPKLKQDLPSTSTWSYLTLLAEVTSVKFKVWLIDTALHFAKPNSSHESQDQGEWG